MNEPASVSADALAGDLLRHGRFVRNVAANLVAGADADDATQETWLAALRRPPRENGLAAWLRRVARNAALRILRSEGRRERRETAAARPEAVVAADALEVEDRERRLRAVYDAVLALDPPFRDVVLCRFYDGLEAAEIAARLGVPAATVRTRLHRALEKLRGALDAAYGDRGSWTAALLPLAFPAWPAAAVAAAGAAATTSAVAGSAAAGGGIWSGAMLGGLIMAKKAAVAAALSAAVLATAWFALGGDEAPPPKAPESVVVQGPTAASRGPTVEPAASPTPSSAPIAATPFAPERERFDDVDAAPAASVGRVVRVTGRVTTEDGKPVADAAVRVRPGVGVFDDGGAPPETTTGADGRFTLDVPRRAEEAVARARSATLADALLVFAMPADGAVDLGDLVARRGGAVSGTVRDERGAPVAGARVSGAPASTAARLPRWGAARDPDAARQVVADAAGRYVLRGLAEGEAEIEAWSDDRPLAARSGVRVIPGQTTLDVDFALVDGRTLEGVVRDRRGDPVAGARVRADREATTFGEAADPDRTATADDRGRFVLRGLRDGGYRLVARRQGYLAASASASPGGDPAVLTLDTVGGVYGRVVDERGEPVADFKASVVRADATSFMTFGAAKVVAAPGRAPARVLYGAEAAQALGEAPGPGWYYAPEAPFREASVLVDAPGFASNRVDGVRPPSGERVRADVTLKAERAVTGVVRGPDGAPAAGAMVTVATPEEDAAPAVAVDGPRRAVRRVAVAGAGGGAAGRALSPATVGRSYSAVAGPDGTFRVGGLDDGVYRVVASRADALASAPVEVRVDGGLRVATADLMLGAAGGVSGRAFDAQGRPAAGARVQIRNRDADDFFADARTLTDRDGRFAAVGLAPGRYAASLKKEAAGGVVMRMRASIDGEDAAEDALEAGEVAVTVEAGKTAEIELRAPALAALSGVVTEGGRPAPGVSVRLEEDQGFSLPMLGGGAAVTTDERGGFYFGERKPGNYRLYVEPDGAPRPIERTFALEGGRESREDVALPTGSIEGRVVDADGRALPGLTVTAELDDAPAGGGRAVRATFAAVALGGPADADDDASGPREIFFGDRRKSIVTDRDGRFTLRYLAPGAWKVKAAGAGVAPATKDARVEEGRATKGVELTSVRAGAAEVVVDRGGKDVDLVLLEFIGPAGETERSASTDARPARQGGLKPGTWKVRATSPDDASIDASATFEVKAGETAPVRLKL